MTDKSAKNDFEEPVKSEWVTPQDAARLLGVNLRHVYRLIERGTLESDGAKHGQKLTLSSVETAKLRFIAENIGNSEIDGQESTPRAKAVSEEGRAVRIALATLQEERNQLASRIDELQEARRIDALELGRYQERVKQLEERLQEARERPPQAQLGPQPANEVQSDASPAPARQEPLQPAQPARPSLWRRIFGG